MAKWGGGSVSGWRRLAAWVLGVFLGLGAAGGVGGAGLAAAAEILGTPLSGSTGSLGGIAYTVSSVSSLSSGSCDLSTTNYVPPGGSAQACHDYSVGRSITFSFASPLNNLDLYLSNFRGPGSYGVASYDLTVTGTAGTWSIQSGLPGASLTGNTLTAANNFNSGVLHYSGQVTAVTITPSTVSASLGSQQSVLPATTMALDVPTLSSWGMLLLVGLITLLARGRIGGGISARRL